MTSATIAMVTIRLSSTYRNQAEAARSPITL
jgi:hypothetical protein